MKSTLPNIIRTIGIIAVAGAVFFLGRSCSDIGGVSRSTIDSLKEKVYEAKKEQKKALAKAHKSDSVRTITVTKYREVRKLVPSIVFRDSLIQIINLCDTVIIQDSTAIADLKHVIRTDSIIMVNQGKVIQADSSAIVGLKKEVKKERRKKRLWIVLTGIMAGVGIFK